MATNEPKPATAKQKRARSRKTVDNVPVPQAEVERAMLEGLAFGFTSPQVSGHVLKQTGVNVSPGNVRMWATRHRNMVTAAQREVAASIDSLINLPTVLVNTADLAERLRGEITDMLDDAEPARRAASIWLIDRYNGVLNTLFTGLEKVGYGKPRGESTNVYLNLFNGINLNEEQRSELAAAVGIITRVEGIASARREGREIVLRPELNVPGLPEDAPKLTGGAGREGVSRR